MDRKEAQQILSALRADGPEASEPLFAEALALVEGDPQLKAWWEAQQAFDRKVAARLAGIEPPEELRDNIIIRGKITPFQARLHYSTWLAAAALVAFLCVAGTFWQVSNFGPVDRADFAEQTLTDLDTTAQLLAMTSTNQEQLKAWLKAQHAPIGQVPAKFDALPTIGCQKFMVHGHPVSLICFALANGGIAHLFVVDKSALNDPPSENGLQFDNIKGWNVASWSDDHMSYMVATQSTLDELKQLL